MSKHVGSVGQRISVEVTLVNNYSYESSFGFSSQTHYIYTMQDAEGNVYVWKTTNALVFGHDENVDCVRKGDTMNICGTVKEHGEYNGVKQTVLTRCKYSLIAHAPDKVAQKYEQQMLSIEEGDLVWRMPYSQYKEHYSDCETVYGSYDVEEKTIKVIIRKGRLKASGVRGKRFVRFVFIDDEGARCIYRAVSEENARKQMKKDFPDSDNWELYTIYK